MRSSRPRSVRSERVLSYRAEAAFARAFRRVTGIPPGAVKRAAEAAPYTGRGLPLDAVVERLTEAAERALMTP